MSQEGTGVHLERKKLINQVAVVNDEIADHALRIADTILNSTEFKSAVGKLDFRSDNTCNGCGSNNRKNDPRIAGQQVLQKLYGKSFSLTLTLQQVGKKPTKRNCKGLGKTCPFTDSITSYYDNIQCDMGADFPFEYGYAVHICHEMMHNIGYCHTNHVDDVAEKIGWIAYGILVDWYRKGIRVK